MPSCLQNDHKEPMTALCLDPECNQNLQLDVLCESCQFSDIHKKSNHKTGSLKLNLRQNQQLAQSIRQMLEQAYNSLNMQQSDNISQLEPTLAAQIDEIIQNLSKFKDKLNEMISDLLQEKSKIQSFIDDREEYKDLTFEKELQSEEMQKKIKMLQQYSKFQDNNLFFDKKQPKSQLNSQCPGKQDLLLKIKHLTNSIQQMDNIDWNCDEINPQNQQFQQKINQHSEKQLTHQQSSQSINQESTMQRNQSMISQHKTMTQFYKKVDDQDSQVPFDATEQKQGYHLEVDENSTAQKGYHKDSRNINESQAISREVFKMGNTVNFGTNDDSEFRSVDQNAFTRKLGKEDIQKVEKENFEYQKTIKMLHVKIQKLQTEIQQISNEEQQANMPLSKSLQKENRLKILEKEQLIKESYQAIQFYKDRVLESKKQLENQQN